jgi:hypothetical protein
LSSANVNVANFITSNFDYLIVNTATISRATINVANIQTANILSANIMYGYVGSDPTSNLGIASKHYVDAAVANVPAGGSDLQNIIDAKGDLLVGTGFHAATRLPIGTTGQILSSDSTANTGLRWITGSNPQSFNNLFIQTDYHHSVANNAVVLRYADEIIMNDGSRVSGWQNLVADMRVSGAGGLDTGTEGPSHWYEVYAIYNSSNSTRALLLHRATEVTMDQSFTTISDFGITVRKVSGGTATKVAQSFIPALAGPLTSLEVEISKTGSPTGLVWLTLEADSGGFPSGTPLATSRVIDVSRLPTDKARVRFLFDTNTNVSLSTTYHLVYQGDYTISDTDYTTIWGVSAGGYVNGRASEFRVAWFTSSGLSGAGDIYFKTFVRNTPITDVTMPTGYGQRCLISYVYNDAFSNFKQYIQKNRKMIMGIWADWRAFTAVTGLIEAADLASFIPPVSCSVQFFLWTAHGSPPIASPIGGVACTDMPIVMAPTTGAMSCNVRAQGAVSKGVSIGPYGYIVVESQTILARMQNVDSRLYVNSVIF